MTQKGKSSLAAKAFWVLKHRPFQVFSHLRSYWLFSRTRLLWPLVGPSSGLVRLGRNVRIQKLRCIQAESPSSQIAIEENSVIYENAAIQAFGTGKISIGAASIISDAKIFSRASIRIGKRTLMSWNVYIQDFDPHPTSASLRAIQVENTAHRLEPHWGQKHIQDLDWNSPTAPIEIGDDVWVGTNVTILKGCKIGSGSIVAAGAVIAGGAEFPERSLIAGNPAKLIKPLDA